MINLLIENKNKKKRCDQRILLVHNNDLLGSGIAQLLIHEANLDVFGIVPDNEPQLLRAIERYQPDVIILNETCHVTRSTRLLTFLKNHPWVLLIEVTPRTNRIRLQNKYQVLISKTADLLAAIKTPQIQFHASLT